MRSSIRTRLLLLALLAFPAQAAEKEDFVIYEAQSHTAEELRKAAQGVMNGSRVSVIGQKVVVYGTKSQRAAVLKLFAQLDHKLSNFVVRVRVARKGASETSARSVEGEASAGGVSVGARSGATKGKGGTAKVEGEHGKVQVSAESGSEDIEAGSAPSVVVMDGGHAKIYSGNGVFPTEVDVSVRSLGKVGARVEIRQASASEGGEQKLVTELNLVLGEWRTLGGVRSEERRRGGDLAGSSARVAEGRHDIQIRVDRQED